MSQDLTELDVFFELFLPSLCESKPQEIRQYKHLVGLQVRGQKEKTWTLKGGPGPNIERGLPQHPDLLIEFSPNLVCDLVQGKEPDLEKALKNQEIEFAGKEQALADLEFILG